MWKLLVILPVIKYSMLVFRKCQVYPSEILDKHRILEYFNQTLHLIGSIIWVLGPSKVLGFCRVLGPRRVLGFRRVQGLLGSWVLLGSLVLLGSWILIGALVFIGSWFLGQAFPVCLSSSLRLLLKVWIR